MSGTLYVVGTPIGNLGDLSPRAIETLQSVDFIAAEDTRVTLKLLNHFEIKKPMVSYYEHNIRQRGEMIVARLLQGESCAIVTDAGMPCISDPGEDLVALCAQHGIPTVVVPGPSAAISALAVSGLSTSRFSFEGFLTTNKRGRLEHLQSLVDDPHTLIFYEAPHKLLATLKDMREVLGDRPISLVRELTKLHEEVRRTTLAAAVEHYEANAPRGEFVLVVAGAQPADTRQEVSFEEAVEMVKALQQKESLPASEAAKRIAKETGYKKGELYKAALA
ncbi:MAG: 16S rRNA (cytidine(1402)-2'-O)-methyltransferase [Oscillospiraceae bacterium]|nr:16S rRNA (cytidine(1402)-2'-O)-methyltransferase [Oscillospiraceae bacterium]